VIAQAHVYDVLMTMMQDGCMVIIAMIMSGGVLLEGVCFEVT
jgi:hypothetical protein